MELNNKFLSIVVMALGIFLTVVSLRLSTVIENNSQCMQKQSLINSNRGVLVLGIFMFASSGAYLLCKMNCTGEVKGSTSEMMYVLVNLALGIVLMVLFSIIRNALNNCAPSLSGIDSMLVNIGITISVVSVLMSLVVLGKKLYANKDNMPQRLGEMREGMQQRVAGMKESMQQRMQEGVARLKGSSPIRFRDPYGLDDGYESFDPDL